jgi:hypothetical protein
MTPAHDALALPIYWLAVMVSATLDWKSWLLAGLVVGLARSRRALAVGTVLIALASAAFDIFATWPHTNMPLFVVTSMAAAWFQVALLSWLHQLWQRLRAAFARIRSSP